MPEEARRIRITGLVQGVGFRPNVWRLAQAGGVCGTVCNDSAGVLIEAWGEASALAIFQQQLLTDAPPLARIDALQASGLDSPRPHDDFRIIASAGGEIHTSVAPDAAMCPACRADIFAPHNRRHRYPFTNCTHCGPRLSIVRGIPYDRANTSMAGFGLCPACRAEYADPTDRRFHAQPNACPECGPTLWLEDMAGQPIPTTAGERDCIDAASRLLRSGRILALMGLGGVHLACDASNETAVAELRRRKRRHQKPLAMMARDLDVIRQYCHLDETETAVLQSKHAPIVLLEKKAQTTPALTESIAPHQRTLGFMLPYTPLHALLLADWDSPLVMTSANLSEEPQCISVEETRQRMQGVADCLLLHNRPIVNRVDDSVVRILAGKPRLLRRARGYAPDPIQLPAGFAAAPPLLAMGGELKNTFALVRDGQAILSQHLGDLEDARTWKEYEHTLQLYQQLFNHPLQAGRGGAFSGTAVLSEHREFHKVLEKAPPLPATEHSEFHQSLESSPTPPSPTIVVDQHPGYRSTQLGQQLAKTHGLPLLEVQHHHAHIAACLAENGWPPDGGKVLGIVLDGLGHGDDGTLWGGEFLLADYLGYQRLGCFKPTPMPGGTQAILQPWRNTWAHLHNLGWAAVETVFADLEIIQYLQQQPLATLNAMLERQLNAPLTSSCGRLFDAVAAALGFCRGSIRYEGQAAIELEAATPACLLAVVPPYPFLLAQQADGRWEIDPAPMWCSLLRDLQTGYHHTAVSAQFHQGLVSVISELAEKLCEERHEIQAIALSGGVFQNTLLFKGLLAKLEGMGMPVLTHSVVPTNDGGLSLGQAAIGAARQLTSSRS